MENNQQEETIKGRIIGLLRKGYSRSQLINDFGFAERTVDSAIKAYRKLEGDERKEKKDGNKQQATTEMKKPEGKPETDKEEKEVSTLPLVLKNGKGEMISPEAVYHKIVANDGIDGERDFGALMKWAAAIEMVRRLTEIRKGKAEAFATMTKPMLDMMDRSRQELDAAAARARESSMAIAEAAAMGAAGGVLGRIDAKFEELKQKKADIAAVQDPMKGLMARTTEMMMNRLTGMVFGGAGSQIPPTPGLVDKRVQQ